MSPLTCNYSTSARAHENVIRAILMSKNVITATRPGPIAKRVPHLSHYHGIELSDDYAWLKAPNWQEVMRSPDALPADIRDQLEAENAKLKKLLAESMLDNAGLKGLLSKKW